MAVFRRSGRRFQATIWPGFVDAITALLLVLIFILTIFMVVQFVLRETISGKETELDRLQQQVAGLADALGLERQRSDRLEAEAGRLGATLETERREAEEQRTLIASLRAQTVAQAADLEDERARVADFEQQVASLLAERDAALDTGLQLRADVTELEAAQARLISEREALQLALARAREEIDAEQEQARLAAARREALEALIADLRRQGEETAARNAVLGGEIENLESQLSEEEAARLAEAAAAEALRERLRNADTELTAMTLALEAERARAEETLTLLAAAQAAGKDLTARLAAALLAQEAEVNGREEAERALDEAIARITALEGETADRAEIEVRLANALAEKLAIEELMRERAASLVQTQGELATARAERNSLNAELSATRDGNDAMEEELARSEQSLAEAIAAKLLAEDELQETLSESQRQAALLNAAWDSLGKERQISAEGRREIALLNRQIIELRNQLGSLQALLDHAKELDAETNVRIEQLGADLNTALARAAAEERRRRELEEAERRRLEAETARLQGQAENLQGQAESLEIETERLQSQTESLQGQTERLQDQAEDLERYRSEFFGRLREVLGGREGVRIEGDRFVFSSEVLFPTAEVELSPDGKEEVKKVAEIVRSVADRIPPHLEWVIRVDGHTDSRPLSGGGRYRDNWELSQGRALSVVRYMIDELGIPPNRLAAAGFGEYHPVDTGNTSEAFARNRRIELKFTEK